jgi:signal transduction histidine kinase
MKLPGKHIRIGLLMIISQVLLVGFTFYWLIGQFDKEKVKFLDKLNINYNAAYESGLDSLLVKQYIEPALGDSITTYYGRRAREGNIMMSDSVRIVVGGDSLRPMGSSGNSFVTINLSSTDDTASRFSEDRIREIEEAMLLRSVKLIVRHIDDTSSMHIRALHGVESKIDSLLFISDFESRIEREGIHINGFWLSDSSHSEMIKAEDGSILIGGWTEAVPAISIKKYRPYLIGQIFPQILFSLILIILTGSAFIIAFQSLRKQTLLNDMRSSFISNVSHELKTPVSTVKIAIEAIRNFDLTRDASLANEYLAMAAKEIKRLELLINKVLDNTIIEQDSSILRFHTTELSGIIRDAIESLTPKILDARAEVIFNPQGTIEIEADPIYLQGVIINLIDNSLKYGNGAPVIEIKLSSENNQVRIEVSDNGPGIAEPYLERVFDKFFRIPTSDIHNVKGYGLGLSFASLIVEMHGGKIDVRNKDVGCTFTIVLPCTA